MDNLWGPKLKTIQVISYTKNLILAPIPSRIPSGPSKFIFTKSIHWIHIVNNENPFRGQTFIIIE